LVGLRPDIIVTSNTPAAVALQRETPTIAIVFAGVSDPVASGIVPRIAVESLLNAEPDVLNTMARVWEPAAGDGNIVQVLRDNGIPVIASDIEKGGCDLHFVGDFLQRERAPSDCTVILTNPPYKLAAQFSAHRRSHPSFGS
jgi:hypothetical protein